MSSLFDITDTKKCAKRKITKTYLKKKFRQDRWGSPSARKSDDSIFYEMYINTGYHGIITLMYFSESFNGYTYFETPHCDDDGNYDDPFGTRWGHGIVKNRVIIDYGDSNFEDNHNHYKIFPAFSTKDIDDAIEYLRLDLAIKDDEIVAVTNKIKFEWDE